MPVYGRPERRPSEERSRRRVDSSGCLVSHDARVHLPPPWSESSSPFPRFPPALLNTTSTFTRLTHIAVFYRRPINVRDHTHFPSPGLSNLTTLHALASPRPPLAQRTCECSFALPPLLPRTSFQLSPFIMSSFIPTLNVPTQRIVLSYLSKISERYADNKVCCSWRRCCW